MTSSADQPPKANRELDVFERWMNRHPVLTILAVFVVGVALFIYGAENAESRLMWLGGVLAALCAVVFALVGLFALVNSDGAQNIVGYVWDILTGILSIIVVVAMLGVTATDFETVMVSALALIYVAIISAAAGLSWQTIEMARVLERRFVKVLTALKDPDAQEYEQNLRRTDEAIDRLRTKYWVNVSFTTVIWGIAVSKLVSTVL